MYVTTVDEERDHQFEWEQKGKDKIKGGNDTIILCQK